MAVNWNIQQGHKNAAWFTTNATIVLADGQVIHLSGSSEKKYKIGDGSTQLQNLAWNTDHINTAITAAQTAAQSYADGLVVGLLDDRGSYDASVNTFPASGGSGTAGAVKKGDLWIISVAGTLGGGAVTAGDSVRALVDTPGQTASNWAITENNLTYVPQAQSDALDDIAGLSPATGDLLQWTGTAWDNITITELMQDLKDIGMCGFEWDAGQGGDTVALSTTAYMSCKPNITADNATEGNRQNIAGKNCKVTSAKVAIRTTQSATGALRFTLRVNGADTACVVTIAAGSTAGVYSDSGFSPVTINAGDLVCWSVNNLATSASASIQATVINGHYT